MYGEITIPAAVQYEVIKRNPQSPGATILESAAWLTTVPVNNYVAVELLQERLDRGESETIILAIELQADAVLMDEARGRRIAEMRGLALTGTLGTLALAKRHGLIERIEPLLKDLYTSGFRMREDLYRHVLKLAGEQ